MKKLLISLLLALSITMIASVNYAQARGRYGSFRVGGYTSHGNGSHYVGGYVRSCHGLACR